MAGTIIVDRIESDASYASNINVASQITFSNTVNFGITSVVPVAGFYSPSTNNVAFTTASTERMRIIPSGNVLIGTTTAQTGAVLAVTGGIQGTITSGTSVASTSGTSIDFTGIPSWVKRITVMYNGVSTNAANNLIVQLGTSSGFVSTGYLSSLAAVNAGTASNTSATNGFLASSSNAASVISGTMTITNLTSNTWVYHAVTKSSTTVVVMAAGDISLAAALTQIRITDTAGTGTFDAGNINILFEG